MITAITAGALTAVSSIGSLPLFAGIAGVFTFFTSGLGRLAGVALIGVALMGFGVYKGATWKAKECRAAELQRELKEAQTQKKLLLEELTSERDVTQALKNARSQNEQRIKEYLDRIAAMEEEAAAKAKKEGRIYVPPSRNCRVTVPDARELQRLGR